VPSEKAVRSEKTPAFRLLEALVVPVISLATRIDILGRSNIPATGAFVATPNHYSNVDPLVVGLAIWRIGRAPHFLAKSSLWKVPVVRWFLRKTDQVPVDRAGSRTSDPLALARRIAERGQGVIVYPEGSLTRDPDLWPMRGKSGAVRIALEGGMPIIPVAHWGTQTIMPPHTSKLRLFPRSRVRILFGPPVDLSAYHGRPLDAVTLAAATNEVMEAITALLAELRGEPAPPERWDPAAHGQSEIGKHPG
jgi:1-acyl-sn-glycerol-3-phosphate acyltransferase